MSAEKKRILNIYIEAAKEAIDQLQPTQVYAGKGYCDSVSFNTRQPLPKGGVKMYRRHDSALAQNPKPFDPTIGLVRFDDNKGKPIGAIFNYNMHPATMINDKMISSDFIGSARQCVEDALDSTPVLFCQGFCSDIACYHQFGTPTQAHQTGKRLGQAAVEALSTLIPVRGEPLVFAQECIELQCQPMPAVKKLEAEIEGMKAFIDDLKENPNLIWCGNINLPDMMSLDGKVRYMESKIEYRKEGIRILKEGKSPRTSLPFHLAAIRIGDVAAVLSHGENYAEIGIEIRNSSPFAHTLICGDINGLFGNIFTDEEIGHGGSTMDSYFEMLEVDGFRLPPAKGSVQKIIETSLKLLNQLYLYEK